MNHLKKGKTKQSKLALGWHKPTVANHKKHNSHGNNVQRISCYSEIKNFDLRNVKIPRNTQIKQIFIEKVMPCKHKSRWHNMSVKFCYHGILLKKRTGEGAQKK